MKQFPNKVFYFVRHGSTDENQAGIVMGQRNPPLNDEGRRQAETAGRLLKGITFSVIHSSPLNRALETAQIIGQAANVSVRTVEDLRERYWGKYEGRPRTERPDPIDADFDTVENFEIFSNRVLVAISRITKTFDPPLIVAHNGTWRAVVNRFDLDFGVNPVNNAMPIKVDFDESALSGWRYRVVT